MNIVLTEKPDIGAKIAAALGGIKLGNQLITLMDLRNKSIVDKIKRLQDGQGYLDTYYKGKYFRILWGYGHLVEYQAAKNYDNKFTKWSLENYPCIPSKFKLTPKLTNGKPDQKIIKQLNLIKKVFTDNNTEVIYNACDSDREGE